MSYDDIRFSGWDDPDDDNPDDNPDDASFWGDGKGLHWDNPDIVGEEEVYYTVIHECEVCGRIRHVDMSGMCHQCWTEANA